MVRLKTRYLLFEVLSPDDIDPLAVKRTVRTPKSEFDFRKLSAEIKNSIIDNFGELGMGQVQSTLLLKYFSPATLTGIIRVSRDHWRMVQAALTYITHVDYRPVVIRVVRVSGTIKKSELAVTKRDKNLIRDLDL